MPPRKIIHVDMDAFYASVEQRDNPELRGRPVAVGHGAKRGVVAAASYEARAFGVRSAMPSITAMRQCAELVFVAPRFEIYRAVSRQIHAIFAHYTTLIEPLSLDEAYLDVTQDLRGLQTASATAKEIRARILKVTGLTASAGISYNKFLAKLASSQRKPNGQFVITPEMGPDFIALLPVAKFHGVGPATAAKMERLGIRTGADLRAKSLGFLQQHFGKSAAWYLGIANGEDDRPVVADRPRKSSGSETTFERDLTAPAEIEAGVEAMAADVWALCEKTRAFGRTVTVKVKFSDFHQVTRSRSFPMVIARHNLLRQASVELVRTLLPTAKVSGCSASPCRTSSRCRSVPPMSCRCLTLPKRSPRASHRPACADGAPCRQRQSRLVAKVDSAAVQDGFDLYLHGFIVTDGGHWVVVQQGMNGERRQARRYHWLSEGLRSFVDEPHAAIDGAEQGVIVNLTDHRAEASRRRQLDLLGDIGPDGIERQLAKPESSLIEHPHPGTQPVLPHLVMPAHHDVRPEDIVARRLHGNLAAAAECGPQDFSELLLVPGVGARTVRALAQVAEVVHGAPYRFSDPARFSVAHGGKDRHPFPVPLKVYDNTINVLKTAVRKPKLGHLEELAAIRRLDEQARRLERHASGPSVEALLADERARSHHSSGNAGQVGNGNPDGRWHGR